MEEPENTSTGNLNALPFSQVSQIHTESAKWIDLGAAVNTARSRSNTHKPVVSNTAVESLALGVQGTLNVLLTSINKLVSQPPATSSDDATQVGVTQPPSLREQVMEGEAQCTGTRGKEGKAVGNLSMLTSYCYIRYTCR